MITNETSYLHAVGKGYRSFPVLALERFLRTKGWTRNVLPPEIIITIKSAIGFFDLALMGDKIIDDASREKKFSGNLPAIRAYNIAATAYELLNNRNLPFREVLLTSKNVLISIVNRDNLTRFMSNESDIDLLYEYIIELAKVLYSDR